MILQWWGMYIIMNKRLDNWITNGLMGESAGTTIYGYPLECNFLSIYTTPDSDNINTATVGYGHQLYAAEYRTDIDYQDRRIRMIALGFI